MTAFIMIMPMTARKGDNGEEWENVVTRWRTGRTEAIDEL